MTLRPTAFAAWAITLVALATSGAFVACGSSHGADTGTVDAGDATSSSSSGGPVIPPIFTGDGGCTVFGKACTTNGACCSAICNKGVCDFPACSSDGVACSANGQCCSGTCTGGKCAALNPMCKTLGNACTSSADCCSGLCTGGSCQPSSFCEQQGDSCHTGVDCCGGTCNVATGQTLGTCGPPPSGSANCKMPDGVVCGGTLPEGGIISADGGLPGCGGGCCSRECAPWGPTGVFVCQPATGCHVIGDLCAKDQDCCGGMGVPSPPAPNGKFVQCEITPPSAIGVCSLAGRSCEPNGGICRLDTSSCNETCDCCAGNCHDGTCKTDNDGVPRCTNAQCVDAGTGCATSADCCNGAPCVPNPSGNPPYVCNGGSCVACGGACTSNSDCCPGGSCQVPNGSAHGTCACGSGSSSGGSSSGSGSGSSSGSSSGGPDAGCALYGQVCTTSAQCCYGIPCTMGHCVEPVQ